MIDALKLTGIVELTIRDSEGNIRSKQNKNMVLMGGKVYVAKLMAGNITTLANKMAAGSGTSQPTTSDTTLAAEFTGGSNLRPTISSISRNTNIVTYNATFLAGNCTGTITELGLYHNTDLIARTTFDPEIKGASDFLEVSWNITVN